MTLAELIPSLRTSIDRLPAPEIWPCTTRLTPTGDLSVGGVALAGLAGRFGTPTYVVDEAQVRANCRAYRRALPDVEIAYAGKAFLTRAMVGWIAEEGLSLDVCSAGELAVAMAAGFPAERVILHGNVKSPDDLKAAMQAGVGRVVVDSLDEIGQLGALATAQPVLIRVTPGVDGHTHAAIATGVEDQKFGFSLASGAAEEAVRRVLVEPGLRLVGLHCHIGSQVGRVADFELAARRMVGLLDRVRGEHGIALPQLNLGGGHVVPYLAGEPDFDLSGFADRVRGAVNYECARRGLPAPRLTVEPGRSLVARAGITLYRVVTVKHGTSRTFVAVDGGMSDNARPALYGAKYAVRLVGRGSQVPDAPVTVVGRHCEAGDVIAENVPLPGDIHAGDLLAVPCTGAYHHSLASNYNMVGRPPVVAVRDGAPRLLVRGETAQDLLARDVGV
ncbi:diaminopimelate decarboxylase [Allokutzneria sp. A3M-2-11 16]|uniref:diaminopimelate decarboxylase n=1 Tax=Allokutzneria sp. A3M-2-11 16 TaxID=2962043 RepID=UPI0020B78E39|nr:diaminopimelate decarboxylase [Allokutzneria sp. A3M-2-11 16]MCP3799123.1 diaminopimelate decarboxylase [Allokutzneria sp. A3M-2-11 16]